MLTLWCDYLKAACSADAIGGYVATQAKATALIERGGRTDELLNVLAGVLDPPPRTNAICRFSAAIERAHNCALAWLLRAQEHCFFKKYDDARADVDEALRRKPDYALAHYVRSQLAADGSELELRTALGHAQAAARLAPTEPACLSSSARLRWQLHDWRGSFADAVASIGLTRGTPSYRATYSLWEQLARMEEQAGRTQDAIACWNRAIALGAIGYALKAAQAALGSEPLAATAKRLAPLVDLTAKNQVMVACQARDWLGEQRLAQGDSEGARAEAHWVLAHVPNAPTAALLDARAQALAAATAQEVRAAFAPALAALANSSYDAKSVQRLDAAAHAAEAEALARVGDAGGAAAEVSSALADVPDLASAWAVRLRALQARRHGLRGRARRAQAAGAGDGAAAPHRRRSGGSGARAGGVRRARGRGRRPHRPAHQHPRRARGHRGGCERSRPAPLTEFPEERRTRRPRCAPRAAGASGRVR